MATLEASRLSLELSPANFKAYGTRLDLRVVNLSSADTIAVAGKWAMRQRFPSNVSKLDPSVEAISRFPGIGDMLEVSLGWRLSRSVGAFAVATEYAAQIIDTAQDMGHEVCGIAMGRDSEASLYVASPRGEMPDDQVLREVVDAANKRLSAAEVLQLPLPSRIMIERVQA